LNREQTETFSRVLIEVLLKDASWNSSAGIGVR
jgi:hypothetical protein